MESRDKEPGIIDVQSDSSYFDYVEQKLARSTSARARVIENKEPNPTRAEITEDAQFWKEFASS